MSASLRAVVALASLSLAAPASAQSTAEVDRPLVTFTPTELALLGDLLDTGVVSLVEFAYGTELPAVVLACRVEAPPDVVASVIGDPARYPEFMPALDEVSLEPETETGALAYEWSWHAAIFTLHGENTMETYAPPEDHPERGYRFVVRSTGGDLGVGRTVWRVLPDGAGRSIVMSSSRMDLRDANYIARSLAAASSTVNRSVSVGLSFSMMLRTRAESERRVGHVRTPIATGTGEPARPAIDPIPLESMLLRGDLLWVETTDGSDQGLVWAVTRLPQTEDAVRAAIRDPGGFTNGLLSGAHANILESSEDRTRFEWGIDLPLVGTSGEMTMSERDDGTHCLDATSGALEGAAWRFAVTPRDYGVLLTSWGRFDLADGLWLIDVVEDADPSFRPGLSSSAELMMVRGLRTRLSM